MILPPYYYTPTDDEIFRYYQAISEAVTIPIMLYNNPVTSNVDMSARLVARLTKAFENVRYIKESSQDIARVRDVIEATDGVMNVYAGERVVDSFLLGAIGYVNPYGNYAPRASSRIWNPTYGHQCYSKKLAAYAGYPVGDVRPPLTTFSQLGEEGERRMALLSDIMNKLDALMDELEAPTVQ